MSRAVVFEAATPGAAYRGFQTFLYRGRWYGLPPGLAPFDPARPARSLTHPAVVSGSSREALELLIDEFDPAPYQSESVDEFDDYELVRHGARYYGVPRAIFPLDLNLEENRTADGVVCGDTPEQVIDRARAAAAAAPIEFLGWLPVFKRFGNCGAHPQFAHTEEPPAGYKFVRTDRVVIAEERLPPALPERIGRTIGALGLSLWVMLTTARRYGVLRTLRTLWQFAAFVAALVRRTGHVMPSLRFAHSRNFQSQVLTPRDPELTFITSVPYTYGQNPWVIEVEDPTTLFYPFIKNGQTVGFDVRSSPYFDTVKALLEAPNCRGIVTHMRSTAEMIPTLFQSELIAKKVTYAPLGVPLPKQWQRHEDDDGPINLLYTNSWHQNPDSFFLRGGPDVLEAYDVLRRRYPQLRLTLRAALPGLEERHYKILRDGWVRVIDRYMPAEQMAELQRETHVFMLPSARIHIVSVLQAMAYGQVVVVSDGWGMDEYVEHGRNGLIVPGRGGKVAWADRDAGMLREHYGPMYARDRKVVDGLIESVSLLVEQREVRRRIGRAARTDVETRYTLDGWNAALKAAFDKARAGG